MNEIRRCIFIFYYLYLKCVYFTVAEVLDNHLLGFVTFAQATESRPNEKKMLFERYFFFFFFFSSVRPSVRLFHLRTDVTKRAKSSLVVEPARNVPVNILYEHEVQKLG